MLFVGERRQSRRLPGGIRAERCSRRRSAGGADEAIQEQLCFCDTVDFVEFDEDGGPPGEQRSEPERAMD
jgi:hypothetical protein